MKKTKIEAIGRVTDASVFKHTKRHWHEWIALLDKAGARAMNHQEIVKLLKTKFKLSVWWQQLVTQGYELHLGRRVEGQTLKGDYTLTITKSLKCSAKTVWEKLNSPEGIAIWLQPMSQLRLKAGNEFEVEGGIFGEVRTIIGGKSVRLKWQDVEWPKASFVQVYVGSRDKQKCMFAISQGGLLRAELKEKMRKHWRERVEAFTQYVSA